MCFSRRARVLTVSDQLWPSSADCAVFWCFGDGVVCSPNVVVAVEIATGEASPWSLSESWTLTILGDLVKRPSGPRGPVPRLVLFSCTISEMGLLMFSVQDFNIWHCYCMFGARYGYLCFIGRCTFKLRFIYFLLKEKERVFTNSFCSFLLFHR